MLNTWTFPVPLIGVMLSFMEHKVKNTSFHLCSNWFHLDIRISSEIIATSVVILSLYAEHTVLESF